MNAKAAKKLRKRPDVVTRRGANVLVQQGESLRLNPFSARARYKALKQRAVSAA